MTAILVRYLGQTKFGVLMLAMAIAGSAAVLESFFGMGITRYVAYYQGMRDSCQRDRVVRTGLLVSLVQGVIVAVFIFIGMNIFFRPLFGHVDQEFQADLKLLMAILLVK